MPFKVGNALLSKVYLAKQVRPNVESHPIAYVLAVSQRRHGMDLIVRPHLPLLGANAAHCQHANKKKARG